MCGGVAQADDPVVGEIRFLPAPCNPVSSPDGYQPHWEIHDPGGTLFEFMNPSLFVVVAEIDDDRRIEFVSDEPSSTVDLPPSRRESGCAIPADEELQIVNSLAAPIDLQVMLDAEHEPEPLVVPSGETVPIALSDGIVTIESVSPPFHMYVVTLPEGASTGHLSHLDEQRYRITFHDEIERSRRVHETTFRLTVWYDGVRICPPDSPSEETDESLCRFTAVGRVSDGLIEMDPLIVSQEWFLGSN